jgi:hypothetical protein
VLHQISCAGVALFVFVCATPSQQLAPGNRLQPGTIATSKNQNPTPPESKRIFGIIPNYRTSPSLADFKALTPREKFKIASEDAR